jgi:hypothetical protein
LEHDLFRKPVPTFRDHALIAVPIQEQITTIAVDISPIPAEIPAVATDVRQVPGRIGTIPGSQITAQVAPIHPDVGAVTAEIEPVGPDIPPIDTNVRPISVSVPGRRGGRRRNAGAGHHGDAGENDDRFAKHETSPLCVPPALAATIIDRRTEPEPYRRFMPNSSPWRLCDACSAVDGRGCAPTGRS